jgi:hypothetical protein
LLWAERNWLLQWLWQDEVQPQRPNVQLVMWRITTPPPRQPRDHARTHARTSKHENFPNVIGELRVHGQELKAVKGAEFNGRWERIKSVMDSGATITVIPPSVGKLYEVIESAASKAGVQYQVANGNELPNLGETNLP